MLVPHEATLLSSAADTPLEELLVPGEVLLPYRYGSSERKAFLQEVDEREEARFEENPDWELEEPGDIAVLLAGDNEPTFFTLQEWFEVELAWTFRSMEAPKSSENRLTQESPQHETTERSREQVSLPKTTAPNDEFLHVLSVYDCEEYECAAIAHNGKIIYSGNYWDFYPYCYSPVVNGENLEKIWHEHSPTRLVETLERVYVGRGEPVLKETFVINGNQYDNM